MAIHVGYQRAGWQGSSWQVRASSFPAALIVLAIAMAYVRFRTLPEADAILYGVKPVIIAIVLQALWGLARTAVKIPSRGFGSRRDRGDGSRGERACDLLGPARRWRCSPGRAGGRPPAMFFAPGLPIAAAAAGSGMSFGLGVLFLRFSRSAPCCSAAATCCWRSCAPISWIVCIGSPRAAPRCGRRRPGDARAGVHDRNVHRLSRGRHAGCRGGDRGHLSPCVRVRGGERAAGAASAAVERRAGAFLDGVNVASLALMAVVTWQLGRSANRRCPHRSFGAAGRCATAPVPREFGLARGRRGAGRPLGARASVRCPPCRGLVIAFREEIRSLGGW